jgi:hypothetical protein
MELLDLDQDTLGLVLRRVQGKDRMAVLLTCKRLKDVALCSGWPPYENACRGLVHSVNNGHVEYFQTHSVRAGERFASYISSWSQRMLVIFGLL